MEIPGLLVARKRDLIKNILVRLPVVYLLRCKAVCKPWCALIESSSFVDLHTTFNNSSSSSSNKFGSFILLALVNDDDSDTTTETSLLMLSSISESRSAGFYLSPTPYKDDQWSTCDKNCFDEEVFKVHTNNLLGGGGSDDDEQQLVFKLDSLGFPSCYKFDTSFTKNLSIVGSCNGLVCLYERHNDQFSICNPATRQFRFLPKPKIPSKDKVGALPTIASFGFDVETKDYKVVLLTGLRACFYRPIAPVESLCRVEVYSLRNNSWRLLEEEHGGITSLAGYPFRYEKSGISMNDSCFFLADFFFTKQEPYFPENNRFIISFDFTKEIFTPIQLPEHHQDHELYLSCLGDKLAVFTVECGSSVDANYYDAEDYPCYQDFNIWVLNNEHDNSSSVNKASWTILKSFEIEHETPGQIYLPKGISNDGEFALLDTVGTRFKKLKLYNLVTKEVKKNFLACHLVRSKANAYQPSLVSILGGNGAAAAAAAADRVMSAKKANNKKVTLKSSDGETFDVDEVVVIESQTIKHMIKDDCVDNGIRLPNVTSKILAKVIVYLKKHVKGPKGDDRTSDEDLQSWDARFVRVDMDTLFDLMLAANYLNIKNLLDLTRQTVADIIKGKTPSHRIKRKTP